MTTEPTTTPSQVFLASACSRSFLTAELASAIGEEAVASGMDATRLVVERGLMDAAQVDIVETLLHPAEIIPSYEILALIGRGGMGVVYRARQKNLDRLVAVKTVLVSLLSQSGAVARFEQEARAVAKLCHPNIVTAYDFGRYGGRLFFVMELLEGETVETLIGRTGRVGEALAWGVIRQTAAGLAHAAQLGIIHRDIKPANLFLIEAPAGLGLPSGQPMVKITDFGLAFLGHRSQDLSRLTMAGTTLGTPMYMAPEQIANSEVDCRADIYSLGTTAFHMLSGQVPFGGKTHWEILGEKSKGIPARFEFLADSISSHSADLIREMMEPNAVDRVPNYSQLISRIDRVTRNLLSGAAPTVFRPTGWSVDSFPSLKAKPRRIGFKGWMTRRRVFSAAGVLLSLNLLAFFIYWSKNQSAGSAAALLLPSGLEKHLFEGTSLSGWAPVEGLWTPAKDAEGGAILSGRGIVRRPIPLIQNYRIMLGLDLEKADLVEVHFGIEEERNGEQPRFVLRVSRDGAVLGRTSADRNELKEISARLPHAAAGDADGGPVYREIRIERQKSQWLAFYDGKRVGSASFSGSPELAEFRLVTVSGPAHFDAVGIEQLIEPPG